MAFRGSIVSGYEPARNIRPTFGPSLQLRAFTPAGVAMFQDVGKHQFRACDEDSSVHGQHGFAGALFGAKPERAKQCAPLRS
jgi:hypothetical protein